MVQFMETCVSGDMPGLLNLLADDIALWSDGGGKAISALKPIYGAPNVARFMIRITQKQPPNLAVRTAWINGQPGIIGYEDNRATTVLILSIADGRIRAIHAIHNPDKLQGVPPLE